MPFISFPFARPYLTENNRERCSFRETRPSAVCIEQGAGFECVGKSEGRGERERRTSFPVPSRDRTLPETAAKDVCSGKHDR